MVLLGYVTLCICKTHCIPGQRSSFTRYTDTLCRFLGYSLAFSDTASAFIGNLKYFGLMGVDAAPSIGSSKIPALLFALYQSMFACITAVLVSCGSELSAEGLGLSLQSVACQAVGGFSERSRVLPIRESRPKGCDG